ncbi:hypothetical protein FA95DRAFT_1577305 [Auriscalpium vulgare]|uniref:Uncharacterized protein n=1 Tax=Auriscalpium vulgare TaxID=40419 RepID=A0ACB8R6Z2_9AGAM|nr:hypothetical protein FA95DRAFT_1577305 [Auriscalpium vulgare]
MEPAGKPPRTPSSSSDSDPDPAFRAHRKPSPAPEDTQLTAQTLNADGTPKRPMNAFMIFARRRRPQVSAANQTMRTGEISKILSKEWNAMDSAEKQFYLDQAKRLKETFNTRYPDYVYRRRPNNSRKKRRADAPDPASSYPPDASSPAHSYPGVSGYADPDGELPRASSVASSLSSYADTPYPHAHGGHSVSGGLYTTASASASNSHGAWGAWPPPLRKSDPGPALFSPPPPHRPWSTAPGGGSPENAFYAPAQPALPHAHASLPLPHSQSHSSLPHSLSSHHAHPAHHALPHSLSHSHSHSHSHHGHGHGGGGGGHAHVNVPYGARAAAAYEPALYAGYAGAGPLAYWDRQGKLDAGP